MCCRMGWIGCAILQLAQNSIARIWFLSYFWNPLIKYIDMKNIVKSPKHFFGYFYTLETHSGKGPLILSKSIASLSLPKVFSPLFQELVAIVFVLVLWWDVWWCKQVASSLFGLNSTVNEVGPTSMNNSQTSPVRAKPKGSKKEAPLPIAGAALASAKAAVAPAATKGIYSKYY